MKTARLGIIILAVRSVERSVAFWRDAFGFEATAHTPTYQELKVPGGPTIGIYEREGFSRNIGTTPAACPADEVQPTELYFYTDDLVAAVARLRSAGARQLAAPARKDWGDETAYFADPDGNVVAVARVLGEPRD